MKDLEHELYVQIFQRHLDAATGLDKGCCPLGKSLAEFDPQSVWLIDTSAGIVCRYLVDQETVYKMDTELVDFLKGWSDWWVKKLLDSNTSDYPALDSEGLDFLMGTEDYPDAYLVPGYYKTVR